MACLICAEGRGERSLYVPEMKVDGGISFTSEESTTNNNNCGEKSCRDAAFIFVLTKLLQSPFSECPQYLTGPLSHQMLFCASCCKTIEDGYNLLHQIEALQVQFRSVQSHLRGKVGSCYQSNNDDDGEDQMDMGSTLRVRLQKSINISPDQVDCKISAVTSLRRGSHEEVTSSNLYQTYEGEEPEIEWSEVFAAKIETYEAVHLQTMPPDPLSLNDSKDKLRVPCDSGGTSDSEADTEDSDSDSPPVRSNRVPFTYKTAGLKRKMPNGGIVPLNDDDDSSGSDSPECLIGYQKRQALSRKKGR